MALSEDTNQEPVWQKFGKRTNVHTVLLLFPFWGAKKAAVVSNTPLTNGMWQESNEQDEQLPMFWFGGLSAPGAFSTVGLAVWSGGLNYTFYFASREN